MRVWREFPQFFRGAPGLIRRARWWNTRELDQAHRLILQASGAESAAGEGMNPKPPPTFDTMLQMISAATSAAALAPLLQTVTTYFSGNQREALEAAVTERQRDLPDGPELARG